MAEPPIEQPVRRRSPQRQYAIPRKSNPEVVWKIVDAQCVQLTDAVKSARIPFLLALLWAFLWGWSLYSAEYGYLGSFYLKRVAESVSFVNAQPKTPEENQFNEDCDRVVGEHLDFGSEPDRKIDCAHALERRREWAEKSILESTMLSFPGGFAKMELSDLGIVGQAGLLLILTWVFYSTRRENHAVRAFIDLDKNTRRLGYLFPREFWLIPESKYLSPEHLTYAYQAVAQRFMFILSKYSRPLLGTTIVLFSLPALVALAHVLSDIEGLKAYHFPTALVIRFGTSIGLLVVVAFVTWNIILYVIETSVILNGWFLASTTVWADQWSETTDQSASIVHIDAMLQQAREATAAELAAIRR